MSDAKNFPDEMSFSFKFDKNKREEEPLKVVVGDLGISRQLKLNISPEDIFYNPPEEKGSFYSHEMGLDHPEIRFSEKSPERAGKEEKKRIPELELPPLEFSFTNEFNGQVQSSENINHLEAIFKQNELLPISEDKSVAQSFKYTKPSTHYTLSEDYFLLFKIGEYRSQTPRRVSKENFIQSIQPLLGRTAKSISKRVDRLRALSAEQKNKLLLYVRAFPLQALSRKAVFDSSGQGIIIKQLSNKPLPQYEQEYLARSERYTSKTLGFNGAQESYFDLQPIPPSRNSFHEEQPVFSTLFEAGSPSRYKRPDENERNDLLIKQLLFDVNQIDYSNLEDKICALKGKNSDSICCVKKEDTMSYLVKYLGSTFSICPSKVLTSQSLEKCENFADIKNLFLIALPQQNISYQYFDLN